MADTKQKRPDSTGKTPYWKVQKTARLQKPLSSEIMNHNIFNTDCRDAQRQRKRDLIFQVRTLGELPDKTLCTGSSPGENSLLGAIIRFHFSSGKFNYLFAPFFVYYLNHNFILDSKILLILLFSFSSNVLNNVLLSLSSKRINLVHTHTYRTL